MFTVSAATILPYSISVMLLLGGVIISFGAWYIKRNDDSIAALFAKADTKTDEFAHKYQVAMEEISELKQELIRLRTEHDIIQCKKGG